VRDKIGDLCSYQVEDFFDPQFVTRYWEDFGLESAFEGGMLAIQPGDIVDKSSASVDPENLMPLRPQLADLAILHFLVVRREHATAVEFGSGYSTGVLALAMEFNSALLESWVLQNRRIAEPFVLTSVDESEHWLSLSGNRVARSLQKRVRPFHSPVEMCEFNGRHATKYSNFHDPVADFVLIDGPSQFAPPESATGFTTGKKHLMPMASDVLAAEHFFEPGSMIFVDGRTSNARFLAANFQRNWKHKHFEEGCFHLFELQEEPLGPLNSLRLSHITGGDWMLVG